MSDMALWHKRAPLAAAETDLTWDQLEIRPISAAKLHLLNLDPVRDRLGARWARLSTLVHKLFENALREAQGPNDRFVATGELCYLVTFESLSTEAAALACAGVAKTVCELLFGADEGEMVVRSLVGLVPSPGPELTPAVAASLCNVLEQVGVEKLTSSRSALGERGQQEYSWSRPPSAGWLCLARSHSARYGLAPALIPLWDLQRGISQSLSTTFLHRGGRMVGNVAWAVRGTDPKNLADLEIAILFSVADSAHRFHQSGRLCAFTAGVSHQTMASPQQRLRYLKALKTIPQFPSCPLVVRIDHIPAGIVAGRLAELVAFLAGAGVRVALHFDDITSIPCPGFRLGLAGLGADLRKGGFGEVTARLLAEAREQRAFSYLSGIHTPELAAQAKCSGARFASGLALSPELFAASELVPELPLHLDRVLLRAG